MIAISMARRSIKIAFVIAVVVVFLLTAAQIFYLHAGEYLNQETSGKGSSIGDGDIVEVESKRLGFSTIKSLVNSTLTATIPRTSSSVSKDLTQAKRLPNATSRNVFYNRLAKCGSRSLLTLAGYVARSNGIKAESSLNFGDEHPHEKIALEEMQYIAGLKPPTFYDRHIHYLDFRKHGFEPPIYINMVREPISRFQSKFNYMKHGDTEARAQPRNLSDINKCVMDDEAFCRSPIMTHYYTKYFCGFDPICKDLSSMKRVELAKKHIRDNYLVIGMTEEFENTVRLLEAVIPDFFGGALETWGRVKESLMNRTKTITKDVLSKQAVRKLREIVLREDYVVYEQAKAKYERLIEEYQIF